jgi:hypothetical protein
MKPEGNHGIGRRQFAEEPGGIISGGEDLPARIQSLPQEGHIKGPSGIVDQ